MNIFADVCPKCKHVHRNSVGLLGHFPACGNPLDKYAICFCEGRNVLDCWIEEDKN